MTAWNIFATLLTSTLQFVPVELSEFSEHFGLVFLCDARPSVDHLYPQHSHTITLKNNDLL